MNIDFNVKQLSELLGFYYEHIKTAGNVNAVHGGEYIVRIHKFASQGFLAPSIGPLNDISLSEILD